MFFVPNKMVNDLLSFNHAVQNVSILYKSCLVIINNISKNLLKTIGRYLVYSLKNYIKKANGNKVTHSLGFTFFLGLCGGSGVEWEQYQHNLNTQTADSLNGEPNKMNVAG